MSDFDELSELSFIDNDEQEEGQFNIGNYQMNGNNNQAPKSGFKNEAKHANSKNFLPVDPIKSLKFKGNNRGRGDNFLNTLKQFIPIKVPFNPVEELKKKRQRDDDSNWSFDSINSGAIQSKDNRKSDLERLVFGQQKKRQEEEKKLKHILDYVDNDVFHSDDDKPLNTILPEGEEKEERERKLKLLLNNVDNDVFHSGDGDDEKSVKLADNLWNLQVPGGKENEVKLKENKGALNFAFGNVTKTQKVQNNTKKVTKHKEKKELYSNHLEKKELNFALGTVSQKPKVIKTVKKVMKPKEKPKYQYNRIEKKDPNFAFGTVTQKPKVQKIIKKENKTNEKKEFEFNLDFGDTPQKPAYMIKSGSKKYNNKKVYKDDGYKESKPNLFYKNIKHKKIVDQKYKSKPNLYIQNNNIKTQEKAVGNAIKPLKRVPSKPTLVFKMSKGSMSEYQMESECHSLCRKGAQNQVRSHYRMTKSVSHSKMMSRNKLENQTTLLEEVEEYIRDCESRNIEELEFYSLNAKGRNYIRQLNELLNRMIDKERTLIMKTGPFWRKKQEQTQESVLKNLTVQEQLSNDELRTAKNEFASITKEIDRVKEPLYLSNVKEKILETTSTINNCKKLIKNSDRTKNRSNYELDNLKDKMENEIRKKRMAVFNLEIQKNKVEVEVDQIKKKLENYNDKLMIQEEEMRRQASLVGRIKEVLSRNGILDKKTIDSYNEMKVQLQKQMHQLSVYSKSYQQKEHNVNRLVVELQTQNQMLSTQIDFQDEVIDEQTKEIEILVAEEEEYQRELQEYNYRLAQKKAEQQRLDYDRKQNHEDEIGTFIDDELKDFIEDYEIDNFDKENKGEVNYNSQPYRSVSKNKTINIQASTINSQQFEEMLKQQEEKVLNYH